MSLPQGCLHGCKKLDMGGIDHRPSCPNVRRCNCPRLDSGEFSHAPMCPVSDEEKVEFDSVKDSGERREFATGSVRDVRAGKGRFDLIPPYPLRRLAKHYENGAVKYGDRNWEKGQPACSYVDSMLRHGQDFLSGDRSEDHLAAVVWNAFAAMWTLEMVRLKKFPEGFNDLPLALEDREAFDGNI